MPDRVTINEDAGIIEVESFGTVTKEDIVGSINSVKDILERTGINRIIVDTRKQEIMPDTMGIFDLFSTFPRDFKVALLSVDSQATEEDITFVETVGFNRGIKLKVFQDKNDALDWLAP